MAEEAPFAIPLSGGRGTAPPISELQKIQNTSAPAGGQGFSLNPQGHIPIVAQDGQWTMEVHTQAVNLGNHVSNGGGTIQVTIPGLQVGDLVEFNGNGNSNRSHAWVYL